MYLIWDSQNFKSLVVGFVEITVELIKMLTVNSLVNCKNFQPCMNY